MLYRRTFAVVSLLAAVLGLAGCGSDETTGTTGGTANQTACEKDTRKDVYIAGLAKQSGAISVKLVDSTPSPPQKLMNALNIQVTDAGGKPIEKATINVTPWMPDHAHGSARVPTVTDKGGGAYAIEGIYYPMAGLWQLTLSITAPGAAAPQDVVFNFCLEG